MVSVLADIGQYFYVNNVKRIIGKSHDIGISYFPSFNVNAIYLKIRIQIIR